MQEFYIVDEKRYPLFTVSLDENKFPLPYYRFEHRVTIGYRSKRYIVFVDMLTNKAYIEDITDGSLEKIEDDKLHEVLVNYASERGYLNILTPIFIKDLRY